MREITSQLIGHNKRQSLSPQGDSLTAEIRARQGVRVFCVGSILLVCDQTKRKLRRSIAKYICRETLPLHKGAFYKVEIATVAPLIRNDIILEIANVHNAMTKWLRLPQSLRSTLLTQNASNAMTSISP